MRPLFLKAADMEIKTLFDLGDQVTIDRDRQCGVVGVVLAVNIQGMGLNVSYDVSWMHQGNLQSAWIEEWRLTLWQE